MAIICEGVGKHACMHGCVCITGGRNGNLAHSSGIPQQMIRAARPDYTTRREKSKEGGNSTQELLVKNLGGMRWEFRRSAFSGRGGNFSKKPMLLPSFLARAPPRPRLPPLLFPFIGRSTLSGKFAGIYSLENRVERGSRFWNVCR